MTRWIRLQFVKFEHSNWTSREGWLAPACLIQLKNWGDQISKSSGGKPPFPTCSLSDSISYLRTAVLICCYMFMASHTHASIRSIWAVNDGEKIERDDINNQNKSNNTAWDGHKIKIFGARNEIIAFQLIVEADKEGIDGLTVTLKELARNDGKGTIKYTAPTFDPTSYVGRPIQLFSINYMNVELPSRAEWVYQQGSPAAPKDPTGWKPVQLVPENARAGLGGFPLRVAGNQNQSVWIEIYTDRDLPAG